MWDDPLVPLDLIQQLFSPPFKARYTKRGRSAASPENTLSATE